MPSCKDPSITFLNKFGYNVVKLPRTGIEPLDVVGRDKSTEWLGKLSAVWKSTVAVPQPGAPQPAVDVQGQKSDQLELSIGLKVLENALKAFGATVPTLSFAFQKARKVQFTFTNVASTFVAPLEAGNFLAAGDLNTNNPVVEHYFLEDDPQAFLLTEVLKSDSISVTATDTNGADVKVDVPQIQSVVGANVGVKASGANNSTLTFTGKTPVTFGFKAFEISFENGRWKLRGAKASADLAFEAVAAAGGTTAALEEDLGDPVLLRSSGLIRL